jgi:hypothetical protein
VAARGRESRDEHGGSHHTVLIPQAGGVDAMSSGHIVGADL